MKVVIVGGVAGGASAAARLRRLDENAEIVIFERSGYISYANCGLPYYVGGSITDPEELTLQTPGSFKGRFNTRVHVSHEVTAIDPENKRVTVRELESGREFFESYDKLILSPGAKAVIPDVPGVELPGIMSLRTMEDTFRIKDYIGQVSPRSAVVVGGGYIGLEMAENLRELGLEVSIVQRPAQLLKTVDADMASFVHAKLRAEGIRLHLGASLEGFEKNGEDIEVLLSGGERIKTQLVLLAVGVQPENSLAESAGLELGIKGSIIVNERMESSVKDIYAVGDAVQVRHFVSGQNALISLAGPANRQGRIAADNICGIDSSYKGTQGSAIIKLFDLCAASTGLTEAQAKQAGLEYEKLVLSPSSHAGYYPGGRVMTLKLIYEKGSLRLLGAQIIGGEGIDKRIDVLATAMRAGLQVTALAELELAYAPPFSSAKDPVNLAGFMAENIERGLVKQFHWHDIPALRCDTGAQLLDTRTDGEYARGHAEGFMHIPLHKLRSRLEELDRSKRIYVMCQSGLRSYIACRILSQNGFDCYNFSGGYRFYNSVNSERQQAQRARDCGIEL